MLEKAVERRLVAEVKSLGGRAYKWESPGNNGVPDRIVVLPQGRVYFIETKRPKGGKAEALQELQHQRLRELGATVYLIKTIEQVMAFIKEVQSGVQAA